MNTAAHDHAGAGTVTTALEELEESTARVVSLRQKLEHIGAGLAERRESVRLYEEELAGVLATADHDRATIARLEGDVSEREHVLSHLRGELTELANELGAAG
jgi:chromosome segregation ATPase